MPRALKPLAKGRRDKALLALRKKSRLRLKANFKDVDGYAHLTKGVKLQLFEALLEAKEHYDFRERIKEIPKDTAANALLGNFAQSIIHTAKFGETVLDTPPKTENDLGQPITPQGSKALRKLQEAGERRAREQCKDGIDLPKGFPAPLEAADITKAAPSRNYGADVFIEDFLRAARAMASIIEKAQQPPEKSRFKGWPANFQTGPIVWLAGEALPRIYSQTFQRKFTATPAIKDGTHGSDGIKFVRAALVALGLNYLDDQTIRSHWRKARKAFC
jgi:hypothetical protein